LVAGNLEINDGILRAVPPVVHAETVFALEVGGFDRRCAKGVRLGV
jgi:hypothetical protein